MSNTSSALVSWCEALFLSVSLCVLATSCASPKKVATPKKEETPAQAPVEVATDSAPVATNAPPKSQVALLTQLVELRTCPTMSDPTLRAALSEESIVLLASMTPQAALMEVVERKNHIRPFMIRTKCPEPAAAAGMYVLRSFLAALAQGDALLESLVGDPTYQTRQKGLEKAREAMAVMLIGVIGSSFALPQGETQARALALLTKAETFRQMNHAGRAYWIASVEQGFLQNNLIREHHEALRQSVELAKTVSLEPSQAGTALTIHKLSSGQALGDGWYRVTSSVGGFRVDMPILGTDQTRGRPPSQAYELVGAKLQLSTDFQHATFGTRCQPPSAKKTEAQVRESFAALPTSFPGATVSDAPYEENFGLRVIVPGSSGLRIIQFPMETCIVSVEFSNPQAYDEKMTKRFLGSFRAL